YDIDAEAVECPIDIRKLVDMHQEFDVPTERLDSCGDRTNPSDRQLTLALRKINNVEAHAANASGVQGLQFAIRHVVVDDCDTPHRPPRGPQRRKHRGVVAAIETRLHEHGTTNIQHIEHVLIVADETIARRINAL